MNGLGLSVFSDFSDLKGLVSAGFSAITGVALGAFINGFVVSLATDLKAELIGCEAPFFEPCEEVSALFINAEYEDAESDLKDPEDDESEPPEPNEPDDDKVSPDPKEPKEVRVSSESIDPNEESDSDPSEPDPSAPDPSDPDPNEPDPNPPEGRDAPGLDDEVVAEALGNPDEGFPPGLEELEEGVAVALGNPDEAGVTAFWNGEAGLSSVFSSAFSSVFSTAVSLSFDVITAAVDLGNPEDAGVTAFWNGDAGLSSIFSSVFSSVFSSAFSTVVSLFFGVATVAVDLGNPKDAGLATFWKGDMIFSSFTSSLGSSLSTSSFFALSSEDASVVA